LRRSGRADGNGSEEKMEGIDTAYMYGHLRIMLAQWRGAVDGKFGRDPDSVP
jgi:hypothetical protein